jgi:hypothetical protein
MYIHPVATVAEIVNSTLQRFSVVYLGVGRDAFVTPEGAEANE